MRGRTTTKRLFDLVCGLIVIYLFGYLALRGSGVATILLTELEIGSFGRTSTAYRMLASPSIDLSSADSNGMFVPPPRMVAMIPIR